MSSGQWGHGLFGCFENCGVCLFSYFLPCYQFGKIAEAVEESCCCCAVLFFVPVANLVAMVKVRGKLREKRGIEGSLISDLCFSWFCPFCSLAQEGQEVSDMAGQGMSMARE